MTNQKSIWAKVRRDCFLWQQGNFNIWSCAKVTRNGSTVILGAIGSGDSVDNAYLDCKRLNQ